ncbi:MAG: glucosaminidase domain-containing protein [Pseudomonadota bacterium]
MPIDPLPSTFRTSYQPVVTRTQPAPSVETVPAGDIETLRALHSGGSVEDDLARHNRTTAAASTGKSAATTAPPDPRIAPAGTPAHRVFATDDVRRMQPRTHDLNASQIEDILKKEAPKGSPLRVPKTRREVADALVRVSEKEGVPAWLMLTHMKLENGFGNPKDATMQPNRPWYSTDHGHGGTANPSRRTGEKGQSHNLFGLTPPRGYQGNYIVSRDMPQGLRVFDSFGQSIETEGATLSKHYRGLSVNDYIDKYYIGDQRDNQKNGIISTARRWGQLSIDRNSVLLPER